MPAKKEPEKRYEHVEIKKIIVDQKYQFRASLSSEVAEDYARAIDNGARFPNLVVFDTGREDGMYTLVDGFQRLTAYKVNSFRKVHVDVITGSENDATLYALNANNTNGARYTNEDKRKRANFCFNHKVMGKWSDNKIADYLGVSQAFISSKRREWEQVRGIDDEVVIREVSTKDGRTYEMDAKKNNDKRGNKAGRKKAVIPPEQKESLVVESNTEQLVLGQSVEPVEKPTIEVVKEEMTASNGNIKVTLGNLDDLLGLGDYGLIIYSSDLDWVTENQELITTNSNVILQGSTGEDVNKLQNINTLANTFNLFLVENKMTVTAYYCSSQVKIKDKVISTYVSYLSELVNAYAKDGSKILLVDPIGSVAEFMQESNTSCHLFYSEQSLDRYQSTLDDFEALGIEFAVDVVEEELEDNSDTETF